MTGAGAATQYALVKESSFLTEPGSPTYYEPGRNPTVQNIELSRALARIRDPTTVESIRSVAQNLEGAFVASWILDDSRVGDVHDIVFNDSGTSFTPGTAATSSWYLGIDYLTGTAERNLQGVTPVSFDVEYTQGGAVRQTLTAIYADETYDTSVTPSSVQSAADTAQFHGMQLDIDGTTQSKEQSVTLSITDIARFQRDSSEIAAEAVMGPVTTTLDTGTIITETDQLELAYGSGGATSTETSMSEFSGSLSFDVDNTTVATYSLSAMKPDTYTWNELFAQDSDTTEGITFHVNGVSV